MIFLCFYRSSAASSVQSAGQMGTAERTFLTPKHAQANMPSNVPSLDEFDAEIEIYRVSFFVFIVQYLKYLK